MESLEEIGQLYGTDKVEPGYLSHYESHLGALKHEPIVLLEIGIAHGASLLTWRHYFDHPRARVVGVDITDPGRELPRCEVVVNDVKTLDVAKTLAGDSLDVVIDDGSHYSQDIIAAFYRLWPYLKPGGWYVVEDLGTQWWAGWGASIGHSGNGSPAIQVFHNNLDAILREPEGVSELHAYKYMIWLRKASHE